MPAETRGPTAKRAIVTRDLFGKKHLFLLPSARFKLPRKASLRVDEVAAYLDVGDQAVLDWVDCGDLIAFKRVKTIRIQHGQLRAFMRKFSTRTRDVDYAKLLEKQRVRVREIIRDGLPVDMHPNERAKAAIRIQKSLEADLNIG